jgi:2-oxoglutarate/2-oxoacid ferredoxin oxidoreductase subunit beta
MTYIAKPKLHHPKLPTNALGYTHRDYEGSVSTLCAGCGHDSISAGIIQACFELSLPPHRIAKLSGIGCSSKTPTYFLGQSHGFNSVHGRMPSVLTGANLANRDLIYLGVSGDGDSASIGLGQFAHCIRRGVDMVYIVENNGVYGLTKGQFSATADKGSKAKRGAVNSDSPIDLVAMALQLGASYVARSFSGDKAQLVPILRAGLQHRGFALVDIVSPCVAFNDHTGSTKSYEYTREHTRPVVIADFVPPAEEITTAYPAGSLRPVTLHDGSTVLFRKVPEGYDPTDRMAVESYLRERAQHLEVVTGLLYLDPGAPDMHAGLGTVADSLATLPFDRLCPGAAELETLQAEFR